MSLSDDVDVSLEERVEALSQYMNECQERILSLEDMVGRLVDIIKDIVIELVQEQESTDDGD